MIEKPGISRLSGGGGIRTKPKHRLTGRVGSRVQEAGADSSRQPTPPVPTGCMARLAAVRSVKSSDETLHTTLLRQYSDPGT